MSRPLEKTLVEDYVAENLEKIGWKFVPANEIGRESFREPLLIERLKSAILRINSNLGISEEELKQVIDGLKLLPFGQEGVRRFLHFLKYGIGVKFEKERVVKYVNLFDFERSENNEFIFSRQVRFRGKDLIIPDVVLYINGIPLVEIECKSLVGLRTSWEEGFNQIKNYEKIAPELHKYLQIGIAFAQKIRYFPIVPWQENVPVYFWKKDNLLEDEAIFEMLFPKVLLDILRNFLFVREEHGEMKKVIARYMQYRAANKIYERVISNLEGKEKKNKGLIWHWQGSGKTLTMIFAAHKLYFDKRLENPTIFFIVDRSELENQLNEELSSLDLNFSFEKINRVYDLKDVVSYDNFRGKRGVFLTLIHKFRPDEEFIPKDFFVRVKSLDNGANSIAERKNVVCFLDEVHRTQYGLLASKMKQVLKNAFFFGFTGTPIAENERNTYEEFGYPLKEEGYLDKYFLDDSQKDGFTLPLVYLPRLDNVDGIHVESKDIEFFVENLEADDIGELEKERINKEVSRRLNKINVFLENENRISIIAKDIAEHFKKNLDGRFKAMVVTGGRKACVFYKKHLDKYLLPEYSEVVMTFNLKDKEPIKSFYEDWQKRYPDLPEDELRRKKIVEDFKEKELSKILIVNNMLITGFDAPILQTIYLDRLLKKHRLLQTIARTNRPYKEVKEFGLIVDYVGILEHLNFALSRYYKEDIVKGIVNVSFVFKEFERLIKELREMFPGLEFKIERKILSQAIDVLRDEKKRIEFEEKYKKVRKLFEFLGSLPEKLKYFREYQWFTAVYEYWKRITSPRDEEKIKKFFSRTLELIHKNTQIREIEKDLPPVVLNLQYLKKIREKSLTKEEKAINILFGLEKLVLVEKRSNPIYKSISEHLDELIKKWKERKISYQMLLEEENKLIKVIDENEKRRKNLGFSYFDYGVLLTLQKGIKIKEGGESKDLQGLTRELVDLIRSDLIENWQENSALRQRIERKTREYLLKIKQKYGLSYSEFDALHKQLISFINDYGYRTN